MEDAGHGHSRRDFMAAAGMTVVAAAGAPPGLAAEPPKPAGKPGTHPHDVGRKFFVGGRVRPFAGNTIIAHLPQQGLGFRTFDSILDIYRDLPACGFGRKVTALPTSSYHMTVFGGANDQQRDRGPWPSDLPHDLPIEVCNRLLAERLAEFRLGCEPVFRMTVDETVPAATASPITLHLRPLDDGEAAKLRLLRDRLAEALKIRSADHDTYRFHITMAYQIDWFTRSETAEYRAALGKWRAAVKRSAPVIALGAPEYCVFNDMFAFERLFTLEA
jgi:hypothetical protein